MHFPSSQLSRWCTFPIYSYPVHPLSTDQNSQCTHTYITTMPKRDNPCYFSTDIAQNILWSTMYIPVDCCVSHHLPQWTHNTKIRTHHFNGQLSGQPRLAGSPLSQSPVILILSILTRQATTPRSLHPRGSSGCSQSTYMNHYSKGFWRNFYELSDIPVIQPRFEDTYHTYAIFLKIVKKKLF